MGWNQHWRVMAWLSLKERPVSRSDPEVPANLHSNPHFLTTWDPPHLQLKKLCCKQRNPPKCSVKLLEFENEAQLAWALSGTVVQSHTQTRKIGKSNVCITLCLDCKIHQAAKNCKWKRQIRLPKFTISEISLSASSVIWGSLKRRRGHRRAREERPETTEIPWSCTVNSACFCWLLSFQRGQTRRKISMGYSAVCNTHIWGSLSVKTSCAKQLQRTWKALCKQELSTAPVSDNPSLALFSDNHLSHPIYSLDAADKGRYWKAKNLQSF